MATGLGLGAGTYWILREQNRPDWDDPRLADRFDARAWALDNNSLFVNFMGHPFTGGLSFAFARSNHHGVATSLGYSFLTSTLWELGLEFREKVSINDMLVTPGAGLPVGEFMHKLGLYLDSADDSSVAANILRSSLGGPVALDRFLDGRPTSRVVARDRLGFSSAIWHDFDLVYGVMLVGSPHLRGYAKSHVLLSGRLVTLPGYLQPLSFGRAFFGAELSDMSVSAELSEHGAGILANADTILGGYHLQNMGREGVTTQGVALTVGTSVGWAYLKTKADSYRGVNEALAQARPPSKSNVPTRAQQYAGLHLPGLAADVMAASAWGGLALSVRVAPSFGALGAPAFYDWTAANPQQVGKSVTHRQGYFYGWGVASSFDARVSAGPIRAGFQLSYARYASQEGWDRQPERLTVDVSMRGDVLRYSASLGVALPDSSVTLQAEIGVRRFISQVDRFERKSRGSAQGVSARWSF